MIEVRPADVGELERLALLWHDCWHEAHAEIVPSQLTRVRTLDSFRRRLRAALPAIRVVGPIGAPVGFSIVKGDELYQLFVSAPARGSGAAASLIADAESRLRAAGVATAWLACAIGNDRAARFYEKCGWHRAGTIVNDLDGNFTLEAWRYEKSLTRFARH